MRKLPRHDTFSHQTKKRQLSSKKKRSKQGPQSTKKKSSRSPCLPFAGRNKNAEKKYGMRPHELTRMNGEDPLHVPCHKHRDGVLENMNVYPEARDASSLCEWMKVIPLENDVQNIHRSIATESSISIPRGLKMTSTDDKTFAPCIRLRLRFHPREKYFPTFDKRIRNQYETMKYYESQLASKQNRIIPCIVRQGQCMKDGKEMVVQSFHVYYEVNGAIGFGWQLFPKSKALGYHVHDVETVSVLYDRMTGNVDSIYYRAHGQGQGMWAPSLDAADYDKDLDTLNVYVARASHASYPNPGKVTRIFGLANDEVSARGPSFFISHYYFDYNTMAYIPPERSITRAERLLLPFVMSQVRKK